MAAVQDIPTYSGSGVSVNKVSWKEVSPVRPSRKKSQRSNGRSSPSRKRVNSGGHRSNLRPSSRKAVLQPRPPVKEQDIQSNEDTFQNEDRTVIRSRARRRRPWEASPFLSVNTVSPDKIVVDLDPQESPASSHHTSARPMRMEQTMSRNQSSQLRRSRTPKLASRCSSRTTPFDFYSFYTHKSTRSGRPHGGNRGNWMNQNPSFITGPPNLWSMGNKFWPSSNTPDRKPRLVPSATAIQSSCVYPNQQVHYPFKHADSSEPLPERFPAPDFDLKMQTANAISVVSKSLAAERDVVRNKHSGRLRKARLKPLHAFTPAGPRLDQCAGIQPERKLQSPTQLQLQMRKQQLLDMLPPEVFNERPETRESVHQTSIASNLSEDRQDDFNIFTFQTEINDSLSELDKIVQSDVSDNISSSNEYNQFLDQISIPTDLEMEENLMQYMSIHSPNKKTLSKLLDRSAGDSRSSFSDVLMDGAAGMIDSALTKGKNRRKPIKDKVSFTTQKSILKTSKATDENIFSELVWSGNRLERVQMPSEQQNFFDDEAFDVYAERTAAAPDQPNILEAVAKEHLEKLLKEEEEGTPAPETDDSDLSLDDKFTKNNNNPEIADPVINEAVETSKKSETMSFVEEVSSNILKDVTDNFLIESDANNLRQSGIDKSEIPNTPSIEIKVDITNRVNASLEDICQDRTSPPVEGSNENNLEEQITSTNKESNDLNGNKTESITLVSTKSENNFQNIITGDTILSPEQSIKCNRNDLKATEELKSNIRELVIDGSTTNNNNEIKDSNLVENFNNGIEDSNSMENPNNETKDSNLVEDPNNKINDSNLVENFNNGFEDSNFINNSNNEIKDSNSVDNSNNESAHYSNESSFENSNVQMTGLILEDSKTSNSVFIPSKTETSIPLKESDMVDEEVRDKNDNIYECLPEVKYEKSLDTFQSNEFQEQSSSNNNNVHFKAVNQNNDKTSPNSVKGSNRHHVKNVQFVIPESTEHKVGVPCANKGTLLDELSGENCNSEASDIPTDSNTFSADLFTKDVGKISDSVNQNNEDELEEDDEEKEEAVYAGDKDDGKEDDKNDDDSPGSSGGSGLQEPGNSSNDHNGGNDSNSPGGTDSQTPDSGTDDCQRPNGGTDGSQRPDGGTQEHNGNPNHDYSDQSNWSSQQSDTTKQTSSSEPVNESDEKFIGTLSTQDIMSDVDIEYDDIPEIDDSVLFCGICGLDEDTCVCPSSKISKDFQSCSRIDSGYSGSNTSRSQKSLEVMASAKECWSPREDLQMTDVANDLVMMYRNQYNNNVTSREDMSFGNIVDGHFHNENLKNVLGKSQIVQQTNHHSLLDNVGNCNESKETSLSANTELEDSISHDLQVNVNNLCTSLNGGDEPNTLSVVASSKQLSKPRSKVEEAPLVAPIPPVSFRINARPPPGHVYYFSYGENMNKNRVSLYIGRKDVQRLWGLLFGFQIKFNKKGSDSEAGVFANIEANPESSVEGCVYLITKEELKTLDKFIGYPQFFSRVTFPVWMINSNDPDALGIAQYCIPAVMYIATDKWTTTDMTLTSEYSVQQCLRGSELLTPSYVEHIAGCAKS